MRTIRSAAAAAGLMTGLMMSACTDHTEPIAPTADIGSMPTAAAVPAEARMLLAEARAATARFQDFDTALNEGWSLQVTGCVVNPPEGGMGIHFGNLEVYLDGLVDETAPEVLLYEPLPNGKMKLVAAEYIVPYFLWPRESEAPRLFGREMKPVDAMEEWQLHVWLWKHNPSGMFADWNPKVTCAHA